MTTECIVEKKLAVSKMQRKSKKKAVNCKVTKSVNMKYDHINDCTETKRILITNSTKQVCLD